MKNVNDMNQEELLRELVRRQRQTQLCGWILVVCVIALLASLALLAPPLLRTLEQITAALGEVQTALRDAQGMFSQLNTLFDENAGNLTQALERISQLDLDSLNASIQNLNTVIAPLARIFGG